MRLDVALFELRLFKSRTQAREALEGGVIVLNGTPAKPAHELKPGDRLTWTAGARRTLEVLELPRRSMSRDAAKALVREVAPPE